MALPLTDVPAGAVPRYTDFKRHVWRCAAESLLAPPWVYTVVMQDGMEYDACYDAMCAAMRVEGISGSRFRVCEDDASGHVGYEVMFADLEALHAFLRCVAALSRVDVRMRQLGEFIMFTLGYRWI